MATKLTATIAFEETSHDCETCGWFVNRRMVLTSTDRSAVELHEDGHFGNADDFTDPVQFARKILEWAGYDVTIADRLSALKEQEKGE